MSSPPPATSDAPDVDELMELYQATCAGPEGVQDCAPPLFEATFRAEIGSFRAHRQELVQRWLRGLEHGHVGAFGLAWAREPRAIPLLRRGLLEERYFYGWETTDPSAREVRLRDDQYPRHMARILALEYLTGLPIRDAVALRGPECALLEQEASAGGPPGGPADAATWLFSKLCPRREQGAAAPSEGCRWTVSVEDGPSAYTAPVSSGVPLDSGYARDRGLERGLVVVAETGRRQRRFHLERGVVRVTRVRAPGACDTVDVVTGDAGTFLVHGWASSAGVFRHATVYKVGGPATRGALVRRFRDPQVRAAAALALGQ